ncbi:hypothetical protein [Ureibacillus thermosphaericus]|uniref:hypothetical protein n=1 Tax=Ureibacillus thermosphaericus TaxID=51173 RepID=UPI0030C94FC8
MQKKWMMYVIRLSWLISIAISFFGFVLVSQLYEVQPKGATGNLGFIGIIFLFPFIILSLITTFRYFLTVTGSAKRIEKFIGIAGGILLLGLFVYFSSTQSIEGDFSEFNNSKNLVFFNIYTFGLIHTISGILGALYGVMKPKPIENIEESNVE